MAQLRLDRLDGLSVAGGLARHRMAPYCVVSQPTKAHPFLHKTTERAIKRLHEIEPGEVVFTDDRAAIELMTNALVIEFAWKVLW